MARKGITYDQVANAAAAIKARGIEPTLSAIRNELGQEGSFSTISQHLSKWREQDAERVDVRALPEAVENAALTAIATIWNIATKEARDEIAGIKEDHAQQKRLLQADLDALIEANRHLEETISREVAASEKDRRDLETLKRDHAATLGELNGLKKNYADLLATLKQPAARAPKAGDTTTAHPSTTKPAPEKTPGAGQEKH